MLPKTLPIACTGAPRNVCIGGWLAGKPTEPLCSAMSLIRTDRGSLMSSPSTPRPRGRAPICRRWWLDTPVVMNSTSSSPAPITPRAPYRASVTWAARSTMRCSTIGSESSEARVRPASSSMSFRSCSPGIGAESTTVGLPRVGHSTLPVGAPCWEARAMANQGFARILLATDGSEQATAAVGVTRSFALASSASVLVVHVWNLEVHHRHGVWDVEVRTEADALLKATVESLHEAGIEADGLISRADHNHIAAAIAEAARTFKADLVVVGSRGLSDWASIVEHSTTHQLLSCVDCPLLIVRATADA